MRAEGGETYRDREAEKETTGRVPMGGQVEGRKGGMDGW